MMNHFRDNDDHDTSCEDLCAPFWVDVPVNVQQVNVQQQQVNAQQETDSGGSEDEEEFDSEEEEGSTNPYDPNGAY
jgi:hypothetical protein